MKITIEFEVENEHQAEGLRRRAEMLNSPNWISSWWSISDVHCHANYQEDIEHDDAEVLTDDEARKVLRLADKYHDADEGINWEVLDGWIDEVKRTRKEIA